jgi:hypothetical protein
MARPKKSSIRSTKAVGPTLRIVQETGDGETTERTAPWPARKVTLKQYLDSLGISCVRQDLFLGNDPLKATAKIGRRAPIDSAKVVTLTLRPRPAGS